MLSLLGYSVWIQVEGVQLPEFETKVDEAQRTVTCWIPSQAGKNFVVCIKNGRKECDSSARLYFDGSFADSRILRVNFPKPFHEIDNFIRNLANGTAAGRAFRFSTITPTDDEIYSNRDAPKDLGTLSVTMGRICVGERKTKSFQNNSEPVSHEILHEKSKKAGTHCVSYGNAQSCKSNIYDSSPYDSEDPKPFVTFTFRYRSEEFLQANGIMPRPPTHRKRKHSEDAPSQAESDDETTENMQLQSQVQELRVKLESLEQDLAVKKAQRSKKVKTEQLDVGKICKGHKRASTSHFTDDEVIDLT